MPAATRNGVGQHADEGHDLVAHVAHVHVGFLAPGHARLFPHVLGQHLARGQAANQKSTHVPVGWTDAIVLLQLDGGAYGNRFLAPSHVDASHNLPLPVKLSFYPGLDLTGQLHVVEHVPAHLLVRQHRSCSPCSMSQPAPLGSFTAGAGSPAPPGRIQSRSPSCRLLERIVRTPVRNGE